MVTSANSSDSKLLSSYFCCLREPPYWMLFPVMVDTNLRGGSMSTRFLSASNRPELFVLVTPLILILGFQKQKCVLELLVHPQSNKPVIGSETQETKALTFPRNKMVVKN